MINNRLVTAILLIVLITQAVLSCNFIATTKAQTKPDVYIGVDVAYGGVADAKSVIDQVSSYTNLVVFGSTQVTWFPDRVNETFQYAYDKGLSIISLPPSLQGNSVYMTSSEWYSYAQSSWGSKLLGFYVLDEPGGRQLDGVEAYMGNGPGMNQSLVPHSYAEAANIFTATVRNRIGGYGVLDSYKTFTSDYALYWYDYKAGYDTVFTEIGGNYSQQVNIALCRGAATAQNKDWGAIITWKYNAYPWIESPQELYNSMVLAYDNGAKYIIVFDSNEQGGSILTQQHLDAIQQFWNYAQNNPPKTSPASQRTAYVLPDAYGFGFRWPTDHIWGLWQADELSSNITTSVGSLLSQYGEKLDILYDDGLQSGNNGYNQLIFWDAYDPTPTPSTSPPPTPTPTPSPTPSPTPNNTLQEHLPLIIISTVASAIIISVYYVLLLKRSQRKKTKNIDAPT